MAYIEACLSCSTENEAGHIWDLKNGLPLHSFSQMRCGGKTQAYSEKHHIVVSGHPEKGVATIHYATKEQPKYRCNLPEKMCSLAVSSDGVYLAGGGVSGKVYLWSVGSGSLLRIWDGHYKAISKVVFTADCSHLLTSSEDASIKSWDLAYVLDVTLPSIADLRASHTYTTHTLGIVDIHLPSPHGWVISAAKDRTLRIHDYLTSTEIYTCILPSLPRCIISTQMCTLVFTGCADGKIYQCDLYPERSREASSGKDGIPQAKLLHAILGHDSESGMPGRGADMGRYQTASFEGHVGGVTALAITADGLSLVSGGVDGNVNVWQISSRLLLRSFNLHKAPVSSVQMVLVPSRMPSEKESQLTHPFSTIKRNAMTGDNEEDYTVLVYHGQEEEAAKAASNDKRGKRRGGKRPRQNDPEPDPKQQKIVETPEETTPPPVQKQLPGASQPLKDSYASQGNVVDIIARLYNIVAVQQEKIRELEKKA